MHVSHTLSYYFRTSMFVGIPLVMLSQAYRPMVFVGQSMAPTYSSGEVAITVPFDGTVSRGEVVVLKTPTGTIVKRIALLPGDVYAREFNWNGVSGTVPVYTRLRKHPGLLKDLSVPEGYVYVLGDNSKTSLDSRVFGPVPQSWIKRKLLFPRPDYSSPIHRG